MLSAEEREGRLEQAGARFLAEFRLEDGLPMWTYDLGRVGLEKRVLIPYGQNTVYVRYDLTHGDGGGGAGGTRWAADPRWLTLTPACPTIPAWTAAASC